MKRLPQSGGIFRRFFSIFQSAPSALPEDDEAIVVRSARRRRIAFTIRPEDGRLLVLAPQRTTAGEIDRIVKRNADVILKLRERYRKYSANRIFPDFSEGGTFHYLGQLFPLRFTRCVFAFEQAFLVPGGNEEEVRRNLERLYRKLAEETLTRKVPECAERFGIHFSRIRIGGAKGRWGSCSRDGNLNFSWRLIRWPEEVVDYVICHELAHRIELNHSARFWQAVERMCPDYRIHDRFLRERLPEYCPW